MSFEIWLKLLTSSNKIITEFTSSNAQKKVKKEINKIFNKLCRTQNKKIDEYNIITSKNENYYFIYSNVNLLYIILVNIQKVLFVN